VICHLINGKSIKSCFQLFNCFFVLPLVETQYDASILVAEVLLDDFTKFPSKKLANNGIRLEEQIEIPVISRFFFCPVVLLVKLN
jgi:hypothetical protein